ncbi:MAG: hypothetical protein J0H89_01900, partial [Rhizobiales bacterium]|jgi:hypothetical protein|nr:hypothetical protein [Hyphomicrobiales bacterium]
MATEPRPARFCRPRHSAPFLAQLIATGYGLPQTRERRRAEPAEVIAAYRAAMAQLAPERPQ